jgi:DNA-binding FadR family transcriptional regulator
MRSVTAPLPTAAPLGVPDRVAASDRDQMLERLYNLRTILPVMATELANARRQAAQLRVENRRLVEQLRHAQGDGRARASASVHRQLAAKPAQDGRAGVAHRP